ncbi:MAG: SprT-like domain-containing protein [Flavobacteriales bacterium]|nr:SprT-like domain-containing protein [Flavobacteriales bacterium]
MDNTIQKIEPTKDQFANYQALYDYFNTHLFNGELPRIILNFSRKGKVAGFFAPDRWVSVQNKDKTHEISINPTYMATVPFMEVCETLVHEQVHLWQLAFGKPSRVGYHNKEWSRKMEEVGLMPSDTGEEGGNKVGQKMSDYCIQGGTFERVFNELPTSMTLPWVAQESQIGSTRPNNKNKVKYTCSGCGLNMWGKPGLEVYCKPCEKPLEAPEGES